MSLIWTEAKNKHGVKYAVPTNDDRMKHERDDFFKDVKVADIYVSGKGYVRREELTIKE